MYCSSNSFQYNLNLVGVYGVQDARPTPSLLGVSSPKYRLRFDPKDRNAITKIVLSVIYFNYYD